MPVKHSLKSIPFLSSILTLMEKMHKSTSYTNKVHLADEVETVGYSQIFEGLLAGSSPGGSRELEGWTALAWKDLFVY